MKDSVVQSGDPILRKIAKEVPVHEIGSKKISSIIERMKKTLANEDYGVAIAAPQIGESLRIFVIAGRALDDQDSFEEPSQESAPVHLGSSQRSRPQIPASANDLVFINPVITRLSKKTKEMSEGCLSVRGKYGTVMRHEKAAVKALDENGKPFTYQGSGLIGHIFQHECDHLDGILYIDKTVSLEEDEDLKSARQKLKDKRGI